MTCFPNLPNVENITFHTLEFVRWVEGFTVSKDDDGIGQVDVRTGERLGENVEYFASGTVAREGFFQDGEGTCAIKCSHRLDFLRVKLTKSCSRKPMTRLT
jgi:hypothetical protein